MSEEVGKGFARRVTGSNLTRFAPLLRDQTKESNPPESDESTQSESTPGTSSDELAAAQSLFQGVKVRVSLPFTIPRVPSGSATTGGNYSDGNGSTEGENGDVPSVNYPVLVAEIPGPGRWTQASFSRDAFQNFFGAEAIDLTYLDDQGEAKRETANPIVKKSSNYCYELGAAVGKDYPNRGDGRPIGVFLRLEPQQFQYAIVMPHEQDHTTLDAFLTNRWEGPAGRMRRVSTDLDTLLGTWPSAPLPLAIPDVADG